MRLVSLVPHLIDHSVLAFIQALFDLLSHNDAPLGYHRWWFWSIDRGHFNTEYYKLRV